MMLVHHDDAGREYDYGPKSKVGTFSDALIDGFEPSVRHYPLDKPGPDYGVPPGDRCPLLAPSSYLKLRITQRAVVTPVAAK